MAQDFLHDAVIASLLKDNWIITHDPFELRAYDPSWQIDLGAERIIGASKNRTRIAVEVKSFLASSFANEFHSVLGQYLNYKSGLSRVDPDRTLFLAVPIEIFETEFKTQ
ncbi:MAG: element excision factor XisH family protein [Bacteroidota bacterium]